MQVLNGLHHNGCHHLHSRGAYEWWYIDALTPDAEWGFVVILFRGMPMSPNYIRALSNTHSSSITTPEHHCGYAVSIYHKKKRIFFGYGACKEQDCEFLTDGSIIRVGSHELRKISDTQFNLNTHSYSANEQRSVSIHATLTIPKPLSSSHEEILSEHAWILASARNTADISLEMFEGKSQVVQTRVQALAYHDHNLGIRDLPQDFGDWYWGRVLGNEGGFVYLGANRESVSNCTFVQIDDHNAVHISRTALAKQIPRTSFMGIRNYAKLSMQFVDANGQLNTLLTCNSTVVENGPFYQRYISEWWLNGSFYGYGTSEFMQVQRLKSTWILPFLRLLWSENV